MRWSARPHRRSRWPSARWPGKPTSSLCGPRGAQRFADDPCTGIGSTSFRWWRSTRPDTRHSGEKISAGWRTLGKIIPESVPKAPSCSSIEPGVVWRAASAVRSGRTALPADLRHPRRRPRGVPQESLLEDLLRRPGWLRLYRSAARAHGRRTTRVTEEVHEFGKWQV